MAEIEPQTSWVRPTAPGALPRGSAATLALLADLPQARLLHGVGQPIGGTRRHDAAELAEFNRWADALAAPWTSEHLSILDIDDQPCGFLMPPLQTDAAVTLAAANIRHRQALTGRPFAFETGVNYLPPRPGEMPDGAFHAAIAEAADCGILLDLTNIWVNERHGRARVADVLAHLPLDRVWEIHLSGARFEGGHWLDAHAGAITQGVAALAREVVGLCPNLGAIIFEVAPDRIASLRTAGLLREMEVLAELWSRTRRPPPPPLPWQGAATGLAPAVWEAHIAARLRGTAPPDDDSPHFALYARLARESRLGALADLLENSLRLLLLSLGEARTRALLEGYTAATAPCLFPSDEALAFARHLVTALPDIPGLAEVLAFEAGAIAAIADDRPLDLDPAVEPILAAIAAGCQPRRRIASSDDSPIPSSIQVAGSGTT